MIKKAIDQGLFWLFTRKYEGWTEEKFWKEYAHIYRNLEKGFAFSRLVRTIEGLVELRPGYLCADIGCGPLNMSKMLLRKAEKIPGVLPQLKIVAVDIVLETAIENLPLISMNEHIELREMDISKPWDFPARTFSLEVANLVDSYATKFDGKTGKEALAHVLQEHYRTLDRGGQLVWTAPKRDVFFEWVFLASIPSMLNLYEYIVRKDVTRLLQGTQILAHGLEIQKKGQRGIYTFLDVEEAIALMRKIGFRDIVPRRSFIQQVDVYAAHR